MATQATIYRVMFACPRDAAGEYLEHALAAVEQWNVEHFYDSPAKVLVPVHWTTHAYPSGYGDGQSNINHQLADRCDILVAIFWGRIGSKTTRAESGTIEEIERFRYRGKPVLVYFSRRKVEEIGRDEEQYQAVQQYRARYEKEPLGLYADFKTGREFRERLRVALTQVINDTPPDGA